MMAAVQVGAVAGPELAALRKLRAEVRVVLLLKFLVCG